MKINFVQTKDYDNNKGDYLSENNNEKAKIEIKEAIQENAIKIDNNKASINLP